jgi:stearoyl-CoA desaturase (Delta-9 desaturase)
VTRAHKIANLVGVPMPLAPLSMGEAWHHKHHAFPTSAFHGLSQFERLADPTGLLIALLEKLGVVRNVVRVSPERQRAKALRGRG